MKSTSTKYIILFDGVCNLCNHSVNFVIRHDSRNRFRFAAMQSEKGKELLDNFEIDPKETDSIILIKDQRHYVRSSAALQISRELSGGYPLLFALMIVPACIRNLLYDYIARNRYKWYGKQESCMIPSPELKDKFL